MKLRISLIVSIVALAVVVLLPSAQAANSRTAQQAKQAVVSRIVGHLKTEQNLLRRSSSSLDLAQLIAQMRGQEAKIRTDEANLASVQLTSNERKDFKLALPALFRADTDLINMMKVFESKGIRGTQGVSKQSGLFDGLWNAAKAATTQVLQTTIDVTQAL